MQAPYSRTHQLDRNQEAAWPRRLRSPLGSGPAGRLIGVLSPSLLLGLAVALAFPFTALSLWTGLQTDTPLAYQGLIPVLAFATAVAHGWRKPSYVWRDTLTELIAALPFLAAAIGLMYAGSRLGSIYFWYSRGDLLALVCFGVGAAIILFGVGAVTRSWFAVLYLFLLWPAPYQDYLALAVNHITDFTVLGVDGLLRQVDWAGVVATGQEAVYRVSGPDGSSQLVGVDSPCAGASGMFGFLVVGIPAMYLTTGQRWRKLAWLAGGLLLLWVLNLGRIFSLFAIATEFGVNSSAFWWTHALLGLLLFSLAVLLMMIIGYRLGFRFERQASGAQAPTMLRIRRSNATPILVLAMLALAMVVGVMNQGMIGAVGLSSRLASGSAIPSYQATLPDYESISPVFVGQYDWSQQFFGRGSTYQRYSYQLPDGQTIWVDSVVTDERRRLDLFNVQGCYNFHGFELAAVSTVDIGHGIVGQQLQFVVPESGDQWIALTWTWPVERDGEQLDERVTILQYVKGEPGSQVVDQGSTLSAFERLFGIGNGKVSIAPEAEEVYAVAQSIVTAQLNSDRAGQ